MLKTDDPQALFARNLVKMIDATTPYHWTQRTMEQTLRSSYAQYRSNKASWWVITGAVLGIIGLISRHL